LQVAQDAERLAFLAAYLADHLDEIPLLLVGAMGKVQAGHIDAGTNQIPENGLGVRGRAQRGNDLCATLGGGVGQVQFCKRHGDYSK